MIQAVYTEGLTKRFGSFTAVDHINLSIEQGCIYGFLGSNGSGKSTTIRMLCGLLGPTAGIGTVLGFDIYREQQALHSHLGYMSQKFSLYPDLSVEENLSFYAGMYGLCGNEKQIRISEMLSMAGLTERRRELTTSLSGGWRQRLALGCAILHHPKIIFLDEPTGGVDPGARRMFWDIIYELAEHGTTIMVTTHFMDEAEHCDKVGFLFDGKLVVDEQPAILKRRLPGILLEIKSDTPLELRDELASKHGKAMDIYLYGNALHVLVDEDTVQDYMCFSPKRVPPSLEDAFIYHLRCFRKGEPK